jgi:hypothetical protein
MPPEGEDVVALVPGRGRAPTVAFVDNTPEAPPLDRSDGVLEGGNILETWYLTEGNVAEKQDEEPLLHSC